MIMSLLEYDIMLSLSYGISYKTWLLYGSSINDPDSVDEICPIGISWWLAFPIGISGANDISWKFSWTFCFWRLRLQLIFPNASSTAAQSFCKPLKFFALTIFRFLFGAYAEFQDIYTLSRRIKWDYFMIQIYHSKLRFVINLWFLSPLELH